MSVGESIARWWRRLRGQQQDPHQEQLLKLYWNRAELKKELLDLQEERHGLLAKLDSQQAAMRRASEQLEELAAYLGRPEIGPQALLYFQLRALWQACRSKLGQLVAELRPQQEERERKRHAADTAAQRAVQVAEIEDRLLNARSVADSLDARVKLLEARLAATKGFWRFRARRKLQAEISQARAQWEVAATNVTDLSDEREAVASAPLTEYAGLSLEGKRIVNTALIAYAEWLIANLPDVSLAALSRQAISVQIYDANLCSPAECAKLMDLARQSLLALADPKRSLATLKERTEKVRARAQYRSNLDTVPLAETVGMEGGKHGSINVLAEDYWSIAQVLIQ